MSSAFQVWFWVYVQLDVCVHLNHPGKKQISGIGLPPISVTKQKQKMFSTGAPKMAWTPLPLSRNLAFHRDNANGRIHTLCTCHARLAVTSAMPVSDTAACDHHTMLWSGVQNRRTTKATYTQWMLSLPCVSDFYQVKAFSPFGTTTFVFKWKMWEDSKTVPLIDIHDSRKKTV